MPARPESNRNGNKLTSWAAIAISCGAIAITLLNGGDKNSDSKQVKAENLPGCPVGYVNHSAPIGSPSGVLSRLAHDAQTYDPSMFSEIDTPEEALCTAGDKLYISPQARIVIGALDAVRDARNG